MANLVPTPIVGRTDYVNMPVSTRQLIFNRTKSDPLLSSRLITLSPSRLALMKQLAKTDVAGNPGSSGNPDFGIPFLGGDGWIYLVDPAAFYEMTTLASADATNVRASFITDGPEFAGVYLATLWGNATPTQFINGVEGDGRGFEYTPFLHRVNEPVVPVQPKNFPIITGSAQVGIRGTKADPIFYPSPLPPRTYPPVAPPSYSVNRFIDPENTVRAQSIGEMFTMTPINELRKITYFIGIDGSVIQPTLYKIRNNTMNTKLKFDFEVPSFLTLNTSSSLYINADEEIIISMSFDESSAKLKSLSTVKLLKEPFRIYTKPVDVTGPVYVRTNLPSLTVDSVPLLQSNFTLTDSTINSYDIIYASLTLQNSTMLITDENNITVTVYIGDSQVSTGLKLHFPSNSIIWAVEKPTVMEINSPTGNGYAKITPLSVGVTKFTATIVGEPTNIPPLLWYNLIHSFNEVRGGTKVELPNGQLTVQLTGMINVVSNNTTT